VIGAGSVEFALARLHARLARRPSPDAWRGIEHSRDTGPVLDLVRGTTLAALAGPLAAAPDLHSLDRAAREAWHSLLDDAANWMPPAWAPAISWCGAIDRIPPLQHLAAAREPPAWMAQEADLAPIAQAAPEARRGALRAGPLAPFARAWPDASRLAAAWLDEWRRRVPRRALDDTPLAEFAGLVTGHFIRLGSDSSPATARRYEGFEAALAKCLRRHPIEPAAVFAWLALGGLDIRRLRGELARRIALPLARPVP
jgi:hypothetical protein